MTFTQLIIQPQSLVEELCAWSEYATQDLHLTLSEESYVFCNSRTGEMRTYTGFRSSYYHFLDRNHFSHEGMNLHAYRHICATMLLESGIEPKLIQLQLGHSSITTTLNIYSHVSQQLLSTAADALENNFIRMNRK
ncbi:MAG: tyrosine-type recombinase/integrase [Clostridiaceae bacterium]|nr:tyrosine-type recombinase/integrase [Clostridiaceae bacterium]